MDTLIKYQNTIKQILDDYAKFLYTSPTPKYQVAVAFDDVHRQYLLRKIGWVDKQRLNKTVVHVAIYDAKFWIEEDWTEDGIADALIKYGIPREDIVLSFQPPQLRAMSSVTHVASEPE